VPPRRPAGPAVKNQKWARNEIDLFILDRLEREGITPAPEADRATLIRQVSLDLVGLLPSVQEAAAFVSDARPDAYELLVDRLLASPHYGERWAAVGWIWRGMPIRTVTASTPRARFGSIGIW
jgi:hypothetical protein